MAQLDPAAFVDALGAQYDAIHTEKEDLFWSANMGLTEDGDAARSELSGLEQKVARFLGDPDRLREARANLEAAQATGASNEVVTALEGWVRTFGCHVIESEEGRARLEEAAEIETTLANARASMPLGYKKNGGFERASSVELSLLISSNPSAAVRRAAWDGLRSIEPFVIEHGFLDLVRKRNQLGRAMGGEDFYDWRCRAVEGLSKRDIFQWLDELEERTREGAKRSREHLIASKGRDAARPYNFAFATSGDVRTQRDAYLSFGPALGRWGRSFGAMGVQYRGATMTLDLVDRSGKYENGFMHGPVTTWRRGGSFRPGRIHFSANAIPGLVGSGERATRTLFHEGGHAAHFANIDMPAPCFAQEFAPTSTAFAETQSMFLESVVEDADWLTRYATGPDGTVFPFALVESSVQSSQPCAAAQIRAMLAICYGERAIYEIPDAELTAERVFTELREVERRMSFDEEGTGRPVLSVPHLLSYESSAYYHGYVLALMAVHQTRAHFLARDGHLMDNPKIGPDLTAHYWRVGNQKDFGQFITDLTGQAPSAKPLADDVNAPIEEKLAQAKARVAGLRDVPARQGSVDLQATIRVMHGHEMVASVSPGGDFEQAATAFDSWVKTKEIERSDRRGVPE